MATKIIESERAAIAQKLTRQPDGPGLRIGRKGEISGIGKLAPGGARIFRERLPQIQAEAGYWEGRVGTVHDFRVMLIDNDTRILFTIVFDGDFKPYIKDILTEAGPWLDQIFLGVWDGFKGSNDPEFGGTPPRIRSRSGVLLCRQSRRHGKRCRQDAAAEQRCDRDVGRRELTD